MTKAFHRVCHTSAVSWWAAVRKVSMLEVLCFHESELWWYVCEYNLHDNPQFLVFTRTDQVQVTSGNNYEVVWKLLYYSTAILRIRKLDGRLSHNQIYINFYIHHKKITTLFLRSTIWITEEEFPINRRRINENDFITFFKKVLLVCKAGSLEVNVEEQLTHW